MEVLPMAEAAAVILDQGSFHLYIRGAAHLVLSPEGDSHRLIRLSLEPGGGLCGAIIAVTGRPATLLQRLPPCDGKAQAPVLAGEYRLRRTAAGTEFAFTPSERFGGPEPREHLRLFGTGTVWRTSVRHPRALPGGCAVLPPPLARRLQGRAMVPADPPDFLDYPGVQLLMTPASAQTAARPVALVAAEARQ
jgi:hypothetical protein